MKETQESQLYIEELDNAEWGNLEAKGINFTLYEAYRNSRRIGLDLLDFSEVIWDKDIEAIVKTLKKNDVKEFTISSSFSGLFECLRDFAKLGCHMNGLVEIKTGSKNWNGSVKKVPALKMEILD